MYVAARETLEPAKREGRQWCKAIVVCRVSEITSQVKSSRDGRTAGCLFFANRSQTLATVSKDFVGRPPMLGTERKPAGSVEGRPSASSAVRKAELAWQPTALPEKPRSFKLEPAKGVSGVKR